MFSITTIASSTTKPVATTSAISVRLLIEKPARYMKPKVPTKDSGHGHARDDRRAEILRRNRKITRTTRPIAHASSICTSRTEARIVTVRSVSTATSIAAGSDAVSCGNCSLDAIDHLDHVGAGLALDVEDDRRHLVHPRREAHVLRVLDHLGDVGEEDRRAVAIGDHQRLVFRRRAQLVVRVDHVGAVGRVDVALGALHVGGDDRGAQVLEVEPVRCERLGIGLHAHRRALSAGERDEAHAGDLRELLREPRVGEVLDLRQGQRLRRQPQRQDRRVGGIDLAVDGRRRQIVRQQIRARVDRGLHALLGHVERHARDRTAA